MPTPRLALVFVEITQNNTYLQDFYLLRFGEIGRVVPGDLDNAIQYLLRQLIGEQPCLHLFRVSCNLAAGLAEM